MHRADQVNQFPQVGLAVLCQQLCVLRGDSVVSEVILDGVKLEDGFGWMVWGQAEDMTKLAGATQCSWAGCCRLAHAISKCFVGDPLGSLDVLDGSESPAVKTSYSSSQSLIQGSHLRAVEF